MPEGREPVDEVIGALAARLQVMPVSDPRARGAILARVRGRRQAPWRAAFASVWAWQPSVPLLAAATLVVMALGAGYVVRPMVDRTTDLAATSAATVTPGAIPVSNDVNAVRGVPRQFVLEARGARRVALVGDFNGWDAAATVLSDPTGSGVWEATVLLPPGRHTYAFLINDSLWTPDPRTAKFIDPDFGRASSVILVPDR